uniref:Uncharacterized protein n=1 Tax=Cacopsylla melanoneura TaxID=428564 RepID=A0A8D8TX13_9HEMI
MGDHQICPSVTVASAGSVARSMHGFPSEHRSQATSLAFGSWTGDRVGTGQVSRQVSEENMASNGTRKILKQPHHIQQELCISRAPYRQGRQLTAVKVNHELCIQ